MIQKLMGGVIVILVGMSLLPEVARQVNGCSTIEKPAQPKPPSTSKIKAYQNALIPHRQTYLEYVKERIYGERLMGLR